MTADDLWRSGVRVTLAIPTYNRVESLRRAVDSVLGQTSGDWELWVLDAGSDDGTDELVHSYRDGRIRLRRNVRRIGQMAGPSHVVHTGTAPFIGWLPDDAVLLGDHLRRLTALLEAFPRAALAHGASLPPGATADRDTPGPGTSTPAETTTTGPGSGPFEESPAQFTRRTITHPDGIRSAGVLMRRSSVWPLRYCDADGPSCDHLGFWLRAGRRGTVVHDPVPTVRAGAVEPGDADAVIAAFLCETPLPHRELAVLRGMTVLDGMARSGLNSMARSGLNGMARSGRRLAPWHRGTEPVRSSTGHAGTPSMPPGAEPPLVTTR